MKISASVYSGKNKEFVDLVLELDQYGVDYFHFDSIEKPEVFEDIRRAREISSRPIDLHLITSSPEQYLPKVHEYAIEKVTFQYENLKQKPDLTFSSDTEFGLAITSDTPIEVFEHYKDECSFILIMTTTPGESGGKFNKENFQKIRAFRQKYPDKNIHVDGGVNKDVSFILRNLGVDLVVSGSYLVNASSVQSAMHELRHSQTVTEFSIGDFMLTSAETPLINKSNGLNLKKVLQTIEDYDLGFTILTDDDGRLSGMITNADVRRGLLNNLNDLNNANINDFINTNPVFINKDKSVSDLFRLVKNKRFPLLYMPVVNDNQQVVGCLAFNNLIKGES